MKYLLMLATLLLLLILLLDKMQMLSELFEHIRLSQYNYTLQLRFSLFIIMTY